ncbi:molybdopterin synthase catalytic subunit-like [Cimex lectularius]|uniref:Uncharacterized protein n=1 Tax=Cimex lectularius TaxID=79782 RepID=A0A8I6RD53_CIMLE|nr:molybdopterin synthase catalytic subunit-like [Cimex lectularius]
MNLIKEVTVVCSETDIFNEAVSAHCDISAVECLSLKPSAVHFESWKGAFNKICEKARKKWHGIQSISIYYRNEKQGEAGHDSFAAIAVSSDSVSLSTTVLAFIIDCVKKIKDVGIEQMEELYDTEDEESEDEQVVAPPELVHLKVSRAEIDNWIKSFIQGKRNQINKQNIIDFCVEEGKRQNCARVDAVLVKRKDTSSHIKVQDIENYWGQEVKKFPHIINRPVKDTVPSMYYERSPKSPTSQLMNKKKHSFTADELSSKLAGFHSRMVKMPRISEFDEAQFND